MDKKIISVLTEVAKTLNSIPNTKIHCLNTTTYKVVDKVENLLHELTGV